MANKANKTSVKKEVLDKMVALIVAAFGLVAALAWNDTIKTIFKAIFGEQSTVLAMVIYAVVVTVLAVILTLYISRMAARIK
ncbi:hypothetical protein KY326_04500 [Candidatus Woesearchaeota archaeon]|nr:hypothetical protein [Candidatus Woesearchaeota archaeon]